MGLSKQRTTGNRGRWTHHTPPGHPAAEQPQRPSSTPPRARTPRFPGSKLRTQPRGGEGRPRAAFTTGETWGCGERRTCRRPCRQAARACATPSARARGPAAPALRACGRHARGQRRGRHGGAEAQAAPGAAPSVGQPDGCCETELPEPWWLSGVALRPGVAVSAAGRRAGRRMPAAEPERQRSPALPRPEAALSAAAYHGLQHGRLQRCRCARADASRSSEAGLYGGREQLRSQLSSGAPLRARCATAPPRRG